jgi:plasmid replication initiation protein
MATHLTTDKYRQQDFFVADIFDASPKDERNSMEHPLFALRVGDMKERHYEHKGYRVDVLPGYHGLATIHDKDIWIYCISQLVEAMNREREDIKRTVRFTAYDFLVSTNRDTSGRAYERMADALNRLQSTTIHTNIETDEYREKAGFSLVDSWKVIERSRDDERMVAVEVTLPDWLFRSVQSMQVLTLSRDYFRLRKALDRRVYELARKYCGNQSKWSVSMEVLHKKTGSTSPLKKFRFDMKSLAQSNELPDYRVLFDENTDMVTFYSRGVKGAKAQIGDMVNKRGGKK